MLRFAAVAVLLAIAVPAGTAVVAGASGAPEPAPAFHAAAALRTPAEACKALDGAWTGGATWTCAVREGVDPTTGPAAVLAEACNAAGLRFEAGEAGTAVRCESVSAPRS